MSELSSVDQMVFRLALGQFASGVTVVTTLGEDGEPQGLTVSSFCSVSLEPPLVLACVDHRSETHAAFARSGRFGVSVLAEHQQDVSQRFAGGGRAKCDGFTFVAGRLGVPLIPEALAHLECRLLNSVDAGDHRIYVGEVVHLSVTPGRPLVYHASGYRRLPADEGSAGSRP